MEFVPCEKSNDKLNETSAEKDKNTGISDEIDRTNLPSNGKPKRMPTTAINESGSTGKLVVTRDSDRPRMRCGA